MRLILVTLIALGFCLIFVAKSFPDDLTTSGEVIVNPTVNHVLTDVYLARFGGYYEFKKSLDEAKNELKTCVSSMNSEIAKVEAGYNTYKNDMNAETVAQFETLLPICHQYTQEGGQLYNALEEAWSAHESNS